jgi:hypothetical protein
MKKTSKIRRLSNKHAAAIKARRPAHKKLLLHPATVFVLLCAGFLLLTWTFRASADGGTDTAGWTVHAKIPAAPLTEPAVITNPKNGQHFSAKPVAVDGSCPYKSYINLFRNDIFAGTALCQPDGSFGLQADLTDGANSLAARVFNITDDEGPQSPPVLVYYDPPGPPQPAGKPAASPSGRRPSAFVLTSEYSYRGYKPGETVSWNIQVIGGTPPFAFNVKWGDGSEANYVQKDNADLVLQHVYKKSGGYQLRLAGTDDGGQQSFLQLTALIVSQNVLISGPTAHLPTISLGGGGLSALKWLWPAYGVMVLMVASFWLGERQELYRLMKKHPARQRSKS